ncbi:Retinol dehydrogenase 13 [Rhizopus stolonifer]|uniref:Retinol dehydrogenase 13 n=1 Tax=Rhizopus stolonifer TaxID=4846 RepID=A0A367KHY5_RHIST|nr:Retinol dehydrogenase 13 [Rhizopus stolonifer]
MLLLSSSFVVSLVLYLVIHFIINAKRTTNELVSTRRVPSKSSAFLEACNTELNKTPLPVFIRVYLIGIFETIYIALCQRGLFNASTTKDINEQQVDAIARLFQGNQALAVITGGDSGIGLEICKVLLKAGFRVVIGTRSIETCQKIIEELQSLTGSDKVSCIPLDLTSFRSVRDFVDQVKLIAPKRDIQLLINNAGIMNTPYTVTDDGYESQCQTNYLSPVLLTRLLLPWMNTKQGRVLFASSSTLYAINQLNTNFSYGKYRLNGLDHYAFSKACIGQLVPRLAKTTRVPIYSYHPGTVRTSLFAHTAIFNLAFVSKLFDFIMLSPKEGSQTPLYLCLTKDVGDTGTYWANKRPQALPSVWINGKKNDIETLWNDTLKKCGLEK